MYKCEHKEFNARVEVNHLEDINQFAADITINCANCGAAFEFEGLPGGLKLHGAAVSLDRTEARLAIRPAEGINQC